MTFIDQQTLQPTEPLPDENLELYLDHEFEDINLADYPHLNENLMMQDDEKPHWVEACKEEVESLVGSEIFNLEGLMDANDLED